MARTVASFTIRVGGPPAGPALKLRRDTDQRVWTALRILARASGPVDVPTLAMAARAPEAKVRAYLRLLARAGYATALDAADGGSALWRLDRDSGPAAPRRCVTVMHDANTAVVEPIGRIVDVLGDANIGADTTEDDAFVALRARSEARRARRAKVHMPRVAANPAAPTNDVAQRVWTALRGSAGIAIDLSALAAHAGAAVSSTLDYVRVLTRAGYVDRGTDYVLLVRDTGPAAPRQAARNVVRRGREAVVGVLVDANLGRDVPLPHRATPVSRARAA